MRADCPNAQTPANLHVYLLYKTYNTEDFSECVPIAPMRRRPQFFIMRSALKEYSV
jgi:hypothetical protein